MSAGSSLPLALGALAGGLAAVACREGLLAAPGAARWLGQTVEPLRRAGREGYAPSADERRRLAALGTTVLLSGGLVVVGPGPAPLLALAGPAVAASLLRRRRTRYARALDRGVGAIATSVADALSGGGSLRAALCASAASLEGPAATEMARVRADLELGVPTGEALDRLRTRTRSPRVDSFCAALASQRLAGGDLAGLLRRFAVAVAERDRTAADARSATTQARFTGMLVAAMPAGTAVFSELLEPGFVGGLLAEPASAALLALAAVLQLAGFVAIARLSRVEGHA